MFSGGIYIDNNTMDSNDIVITGIAGRYPQCDSFDEFKEALLRGDDLVTEDDLRFPPGLQGTPRRAGKINNIEYFDAGYFGITPRQAEFMDPRFRIMFETAFETIVDAGYNPKELRGSRTGVYIGIGNFDSAEVLKEIEDTAGYTMIGTSLGQIANRTSFCFDLRGPSLVLDTACASGFYAFAQATRALEDGEIESAVVSAVNINLNPHESKGFTSLNMLSPEGKCKVFTPERDGYARSEAIITILLQKRKNARRIYSTVLGAGVNCDGFKVEGITFPSSEMQSMLIKELYAKKNINPLDVSFVEMHATGTPAGDSVECISITDFFCKDRKKPLPVGAVKSNMGHSEVSSGMCSLSKVLIAMETGIIPRNLHCDNLDSSLTGIGDGRLLVVRENYPWEGGIASLNCFGFGGANAHLILKSHDKPKLKPTKKTHRLVHVSGRTEESVKYYLDKVVERQEDDEFLALVDEIHKMDVEAHYFRGYTILGGNPVNEIGQVTREKRPIFFIYCGMGSQWPAMGKDLMKIDIFRNSFMRCANALKPYNVDLEKVVLSEDPAISNNIINFMPAITAIQIALTDLLKSLGIEPDGFAGHSLGEVGCAYCNGDITPEQAALLSFARAYASKKSKCVPGQMAAIGLSKEELTKYLPEGVYIACYNTNSSVTITGPQTLVAPFVASLTEKGIFARLVNSANYAFHSKYLDDVAPILQDFLEDIIKDPKPRSSKWISSSWKDSEWDNPLSKLNSADYHYNNYRRPVLFDQVFNYIPKNAILIEIGPHGLLTSLLKREMGPEATCLSLANRNSTDNIQFLLSNLGKLFINGGQPNLRKLYESVKFPVGRGTYNIGSLVKWDHNIKWFTPFYKRIKSFGKEVKVNTSKNDYNYLKGHNIDGRVLMAATGYLELVWKVMAQSISKTHEEVPVVFESVKFLRATVLPDDQDVEFTVNIMKKSGNFEVFEGGSVCCSGIIRTVKDISKEFIDIDICTTVSSSNGYLPLRKQDVYKLFHLKRYLYNGFFQGIELVNVHGTYGNLTWNNNYTAFLDTMLQMTLISDSSNEFLLPSRLEKVVIDPVKHMKQVSEQNSELSVYFERNLNLLRSGGIEIVEMEASSAPKKHIITKPVLENQVFVPYLNDRQENGIDMESALKLALQIVKENVASNPLFASEIVFQKENSLVETVQEMVRNEPAMKVSFLEEHIEKADLILYSNVHLDKSSLTQVKADAFILYAGDKTSAQSLQIPIVYQNTFKQKGIFLLRNTTPLESHGVVQVSNKDFGWLKSARDVLIQKKILYLLSQNEELSGIVGLVKCLNLEPTEDASVKCIFIQGNHEHQFSLTSEFYKEQLSKKLLMNVLKDGVWGSYRHLSVNEMRCINVKHSYNCIQTLGDLSTFKWVERSPYYHRTSQDSEYVYVYYSSLNFKDVMISSGKLAMTPLGDSSVSDNAVGLEYSGITKSGRRIMGIGPVPCISLQLMSDPLFTWDVPQSWTLEEAATIPVVYATCYYAMIIRGQMKPGSSILIHAGAGGVGVAAISIALSMNCNVFTTCGSDEKKEFLLNMFPKLKPENIGNSRNGTFKHMVMRNTRGKGVDFVLNSLAADLFQASIRCVAQKGQFLEIGKVDLWAGTPVSASLFAKNTSFHGILLDDILTDETKMEINRLLADGILTGVVRPLPRTVFTEDKVEDAFRFLSTGKHKGKVLIQIRSENLSKSHSPERTIKAEPKLFFDPEKTYILVGGLGGFGLELTSFLIKRCARKIILNSRKGVTNGYQSLCLKKWSDIEGVTVKVSQDDTSSLSGAESLIKFAEELGPVGGIFNMALVLRDNLFIKQTPEAFEDVFRSKIYSGANLDKLSRELCPNLDHFVVLSSIATGRGNPGQSNYGMANSALERLCELRRRDGLPGLAVQYGPVGDVGVVVQDIKYDSTIASFGLVPQPISSCLEVLENFMLQPGIVGSTFVPAEETTTLSSSFAKTLTETIAHILGIRDISLINGNETLAQMGLDSLMVAEIKQTLYRNYDIELGTDEIRELTFDIIGKMLESPDEKKNNTKKDKGVVQNFTEDFLNINAMLRKEAVVEVLNGHSYTKQVFLLPAIEGNVEILLPLAKKIKAKVYGLQTTANFKYHNLKSYATHFIKQIRDVQKAGPYFICGYSFGASVGFEISLQLEKQNEKVNLFLIDGSPGYVKRVLNYFREHENKGDISSSKVRIYRSFLTTFKDFDQVKANQIFDENLPLQENLDRLGQFVAKHTNYHSKDAVESAEEFANKVAAAFYYEPDDVFNGSVTLLRSNSVFKELSESYDLQEICKQPVKVESLTGDHQQIVQGDNMTILVDHINNFLNQ